MIVKTTSEMKRHLLSFNLKLDEAMESRFSSFLARAQEWVTDKIIGEQLETALEPGSDIGQNDPHEKLRGLAGRVISELAYLASIAESDLQRSEAGFVVQNNDKMSPASLQRVERLIQSLNERINSDCDSLVNYLLKNSAPDEENPSPYEDWRDTDQFEFLTDAFIPTMGIMRQNTSSVPVQRWADFYDMQPKMNIALRTSVARYVSIEQIDVLLSDYRTDELQDVQKKVLHWLRMAVLAEVTNADNAAHFAIEARNYMLQHESSFPEFVASDCYELPSPFHLGDGTVANLL